MKWSTAHAQWCRQCHLLHTLEIKAIVSSDPCFNWPRSPLPTNERTARFLVIFPITRPRSRALSDVLKGLSHLVQSCLLYRKCMSKDSTRSTGHVDHFFPIKYCVACKKSTFKVLINLGFVIWRQSLHFCFSDTFMAHNIHIQWFCYSKYLHVNRNHRPNGTATSLSPKCYSGNVLLVFCATADFEMKYFLTKALVAFWLIPNWFSRFCSQNGYLNSKLIYRWDGHFNCGGNSPHSKNL